MSGKVLLGFGGTIDVEIGWDAAVLTRLAVEHGVTQAELAADVTITDERSLVVSILAFMRDGVGGERFVADEAALESFPERFVARTTLGGSGVRAALALDSLGISSIVQLVSTNDTTRRLMPPRVETICSATHDSMHPHLIVQYPEGAVVRTKDLLVRAPQSNRLIYVNDPPNRDLVLSDELDRVAPSVSLLLVTGLNTMRDPELLEDRLERISKIVGAMPDDGCVIFEDAGAHVPELSARVHAAMASLANVMSMNEDEMFAHSGRSVDLLDVDAVHGALRDVAGGLAAPLLIVHTKHWAVAVGPDAARFRTALESGIVTAATRYLVGDSPTVADYQRTAEMPAQLAGVRFAAELERRFGSEAVCVPALQIETAHPTTIGLGDSFVGGLIAALVRDQTHDREGVRS